MDTNLLKELRRRAHALKPIVRIGQNGLTDAVVAELDGALTHHELVKVKLAGDSADARREQVRSMCASTSAEPVQQIGHTATLWREAPKKPASTAKRSAAKKKPRPSSKDRTRGASQRSSMRPGTRR